MQRAGSVEPNDAPSTGANLGDVDSGDAESIAGATVQSIPDIDPGADFVFRRTVQLAVLDNRRLSGGAAHI